MLTFAPNTLTDVTSRLHVQAERGQQLSDISINGKPTPFFGRKTPKGDFLAMLFVDPEDVAGGDVSVRAVGPGFDETSKLPIDPAAMSAATSMLETRNIKRQWLESHVRCPQCGAGLAFDGDAQCQNGHEYQQAFHCMNLLSREISDEAKLAGGEFVSRHALHPVAAEIIEHAKQKDGMALDFGAGLKFISDYSPHAINLEIEPYPTTDIVAAGQKLPFPDNTFEGVFAMAVLEHVSDPFGCAKEMARVLKPGGKLLVGVPFLFQEHGYPEHYYNMTRRGVANLFEDHLEITKQWYGRAAIPSLLKQYHANLPPKAALAFENLTVGQLIRGDAAEVNKLSMMNLMSDEARWRFAHGSYLTATKA